MADEDPIVNNPTRSRVFPSCATIVGGEPLKPGREGKLGERACDHNPTVHGRSRAEERQLTA